jgi:hypothetical protein
MNIRRISAALAATAAAAAAALAGTPAQSATTEGTGVPTYQEYRAQAHLDEDGQFIVNGDEPVASEGALRQYYDSMTTRTRKPSGTDGTSLVVNRVSGRDDKWSATAARNLTYCVSTRFGSSQTAVINAMAQGAALWENASSGIDFRYVSSQNASCNVRNTSVVFSVEPTSTSSYIARAFFPSTAKSGRNVLVNASSLLNSGSWTPGNIMGHELGHALGFRHEHTRPEAGTCFEDNNWRALTPYDGVSIMHYPQCNGDSSTLRFSTNDGVGVRSLYGS